MGRTADAIAEGLQIAWAAARLAVKNIILVETIARGEDYHPQAVAAYAREVMLGLAREQEAADELVKRQHKKAWGRHSDPMGTHDYRERDRRNLRRRSRQYEGIAKGLRLEADDPDAMMRLVEEARESAWADVEGNLNRRLRVEGMRADADPQYESMRDARMAAVTAIDLQRLKARQRKLGHLPEGAGPPTAEATAIE